MFHTESSLHSSFTFTLSLIPITTRMRKHASIGALYSRTPLNRHPTTADTCDKTDSSKSPERISLDFNTFKTPELRTPRYSVRRVLNLSRSSLRNRKITRYNPFVHRTQGYPPTLLKLVTPNKVKVIFLELKVKIKNLA